MKQTQNQSNSFRLGSHRKVFSLPNLENNFSYKILSERKRQIKVEIEKVFSNIKDFFSPEETNMAILKLEDKDQRKVLIDKIQKEQGIQKQRQLVQQQQNQLEKQGKDNKQISKNELKKITSKREILDLFDELVYTKSKANIQDHQGSENFDQSCEIQTSLNQIDSGENRSRQRSMFQISNAFQGSQSKVCSINSIESDEILEIGQKETLKQFDQGCEDDEKQSLKTGQDKESQNNKFQIKINGQDPYKVNVISQVSNEDSDLDNSEEMVDEVQLNYLQINNNKNKNINLNPNPSLLGANLNQNSKKQIKTFQGRSNNNRSGSVIFNLEEKKEKQNPQKSKDCDDHFQEKKLESELYKNKTNFVQIDEPTLNFKVANSHSQNEKQKQNESEFNQVLSRKQRVSVAPMPLKKHFQEAKSSDRQKSVILNMTQNKLSEHLKTIITQFNSKENQPSINNLNDLSKNQNGSLDQIQIVENIDEQKQAILKKFHKQNSLLQKIFKPIKILKVGYKPAINQSSLVMNEINQFQKRINSQQQYCSISKDEIQKLHISKLFSDKNNPKLLFNLDKSNSLIEKPINDNSPLKQSVLSPQQKKQNQFKITKSQSTQYLKKEKSNSISQTNKSNLFKQFSLMNDN